MFEHRSQPLLPKRLFIRRVLFFFFVALAILAASLAIGVSGYHYLEGFTWVDAFMNAAMILGGMGPAGELHTNSGKVFASLYALFSGIVFLVVVGVLFAPIFHRFFHHLHLDIDS